MTPQPSNKRPLPSIRINEALDKLAKQVLFPEKLAAANRTLKKVGLPKQAAS